MEIHSITELKMKIHLFTTIALLSLSLTGCVSLAVGELTRGKQIASKWDNQCLVLLQDVNLREGRETFLRPKETMLVTKDARGNDYLKIVDQIPAGTQLRVAKIYDWMLSVGKAPFWEWRIELQIMQGKYQGLKVNIPVSTSSDPYILDASARSYRRYWIDYTNWTRAYDRHQLNPDSIVFDPTILRPCD